MWAGRAANKRARSTERVRGSLLKRSSVRKLASFHLLRFAPNSLSFRSSIDGKSIKVVHPPPERVRCDEDRDREKKNIRVPPSRSIDSRLELFEASNFQENLGGAEIKRAKKASSLTVRCLLLSRLCDCPSLVLFLSREGEGGGVSGVQRLNDRIPRPSNRVFAGSVCRLSTN